MTQLPDAPDIARTMATGYPHEPDFGVDCPSCGGLMETSYEIDGKEMCEACFKEWLEDFVETNAEMIADALGVQWRRQV